MAEPTVQVPVSLIERAALSIAQSAWPDDELVEALALLSQPTPSAEHKHVCGVSAHNGMCTCEVCGARWDARPAEPPSIADMAPGRAGGTDATPSE